MKTFAKYLYTVIFMLISIAPLCLFVLPGRGQYASYAGDGTTDRATIEKTEAVAFPSIFDGTSLNLSFDDECERWLNQNIPFRDTLLSNINVIYSDLLMTTTSNVVAGKNGWVFSTETTDDYTDTNAMSADDIRNIATTLALIEERVESGGGNFLFVPVPNKNTIYPEYMPKRYIKAAENNLDRIYAELDKAGVNYTNLKSVLLESKEESMGRLYYKRDTHWTVIGALRGYENIMEGLNRTPLATNKLLFASANSKSGDLDKLLFPTGSRTDDDYVDPDPIDYDSFEFIYPSDTADTKAQLENFMSDREDHDNNFTAKKRTPADDSSLYMIRDSFARALLPYLIDSYSEATFVRTTTPSIEKSIECSDVVYEICERNLGNLIESAPFMYAPLRENHSSDASGSSAGSPDASGGTTGTYSSELNTCLYSDEGYALRIYGTIDPAMLGDDGRVYVKLYDDASHVKVFEAFPIYEEALISAQTEAFGSSSVLGSGAGISAADSADAVSANADVAKSTCGYSMYIDKNVLDADAYTVSILSGSIETDTVARIDLNSGAASASASDFTGEGYMGTADPASVSAQSASGSSNPYQRENKYHMLVYRGVNIGIGDNMNSLKTGLGAQSAPSEIITSCLSGEDAIIYYYPSVTIEADMDGTIYYISLMDNSYSDGQKIAETAKGITIGSDKEDIWENLGNPAAGNDKNCIYQTDHLNVTYSFKNGKITSVILEDRRYSTEDALAIYKQANEDSGMEYDKGEAYLYDDAHLMQTGWQIIDGEYYFFDRLTGERIVGQTVDGIDIGENGEVNPSEYEKSKIETMMKAHQIMVENTLPTDTMEEKRRKVFDWVLSFPYHRYRSLKGIYNDEGIEILMANDIFEENAGDCVSESAALAFLFHEIGYDNVYWVHDTGHSWVRSDDKLFDPLFAESRGFEENYDAPFTDYRKSMNHAMKIY